MAVTTRKRAAPTTKTTPRKAPAKRVTKEKPVEPASESESEEEGSEVENKTMDQNEQQIDEKEPKSGATKDNESSDEETFKIHVPKTPAQPRITPATLPSMTFEDDSEDEESDAAPEAETLSSAKAKVLSAQDKERSFLSKIQAEQKAKKVEREAKLKEQKEQSKKKKAELKKTKEVTIVDKEEKYKKEDKDGETEDNENEKAKDPSTKPTLPTMLPMDILESVAQMEDINAATPSTSVNKKHMRPEDFALMELEAELKAEAAKRKKVEKTQRNVGPVTVKVLDQSKFAKGHAIPETIVDFRKQHFFGSKIQRKDAVLNMSQRNIGAAGKFNRRK
ncbi:hypothetical protein BX616_004487 [Lobosporangium transversale]|uniref:U3 snoRNA associated-domain-containing protein n=1 Tax=Lobosporangium transversale TaxID=64571 RepID=A0A1Y2GCS7_9FUNG|nr:hypothetical protein BCR41DRAFT_388940 [Lobosporangium transversale]KAF9916155.1 hypothetical protein BX616_004487 [Lobosporangium transversale]ORZ07242.1 hypothetical protein BCR41DRAFT_388940 [Lobosporangium transversale]|eukprot:XP_021877905.1 hypothetical protein BCR41DRAFT_388940 [Lobosporangium transversale]